MGVASLSKYLDMVTKINRFRSNLLSTHCVKKVRIRRFSNIPTIYGKIRRISPYSLRMRENMDQKTSEYGNFPRSDSLNGN